MSNPCTNMKAPSGRLSGDGSSQDRKHRGYSGQLPPNIVCAPPNFVVLRNFCFKHMIITKILPPKNVCVPPKS